MTNAKTHNETDDGRHNRYKVDLTADECNQAEPDSRRRDHH